MTKSLARIGFALAFLSTVVAGRAQAQQRTGRWMFEAGVSGAPNGAPDLQLFAGGTRRMATTGPVEWSVGAAVYGLATLSRGNRATVTPYCPGGCVGLNDFSEMLLPVTAGVTVRLVGLPWIFNRIIPEFGTGGYYTTWRNLPQWDAHRAPVLTGYRLYAVGLRLSKHMGVSVGTTDFRNVTFGYHKTPGWLALQVRRP